MSNRTVALRKTGTPGWTTPGHVDILRKLQKQGRSIISFAGPDPRILFTRASNAWDVVNGALVQYANDVQRFKNGMFLAEPGRTNSLLWNRDLRTTAEAGSSRPWATLGTATVALAGTSFPGGSEWNILTFNAAFDARRQQLTASGGSTIASSVYISSAGTATNVRLRLSNATGTNYIEVPFNPTTGALGATTVVGTGALAAWGATVETVATGIYRVSIVGSISDANPYFQITTGSAGTATAYVWGAQAESSQFPSSPILTTTSTVARSADLATISNLASIGYNQDEGTYIWEVQLYGATGPNIYGVNGAAYNDIYRGNISSAGNGQYVGLNNSGATDFILSTVNGVAAATMVKIGYYYHDNDCGVCLNGGAINRDTSVSINKDANLIKLYTFTSGVGPVQYKSLRYFPAQLSNAEIQALTA